jgi:magnesium transporter
MPLSDIDILRRRYSTGFPIDLVEFIVYSYNEQTFEEKYFRSVSEVIRLLKQDIRNEKSYWIEVINQSSVNLPNNIKLLCQYLDIHPLTIEDISTLSTHMKIDFFSEQSALYLLMKIISWNGQRVEQQQISFYFKSSKKILVTFQEKSNDDQLYFDPIRNHLRFKQINIDYLFYCLFDTIIDQSIFVIDQIAQRIDQFDEKLMIDKQSLTLETFYHLKHDLLHLKILFNPLMEIISRLQRTTEDNRVILEPQIKTIVRLDLKHHIIQLNDLLEIQYESISNLLSFWLALNNNETQEILKILMLISALFMPCLLLVGINTTNFHRQQQQYGYYTVLILSAVIFMAMLTWYKLKRWI